MKHIHPRDRSKIKNNRLYLAVILVTVLFSASSIFSPLTSARVVDSALKNDANWPSMLLLFVMAYLTQIALSALDY